LLSSIYRDFGFPEFRVKFSDRPAMRAGADDVWDRAEQALKEACATAGVEYTLNPGEGAFYGPKLEFVLRDAIGRDWQCGTLQVDFVLPERLDAEYVAEDGSRRRPVMLHRAILGSLERFMGILIEHCAGAFPVWLAPVQLTVLPITDRAHEYAQAIRERALDLGFRVELDLRNEKVNAKIRDAQLSKIPYMLVLGDREAAAGTVSVRHRHKGDLGAQPLEAFLEMLGQEIKTRAR